MYVKKAGGKVFGAKFTAAEQKAMDIEIGKQIAAYDRQNELEIDAMVLWVLYQEFGFGEKRLRRVFDSFSKHLDRLVKAYEMDDKDTMWLCTQMLKEKGIDIEQWVREKEEQEGGG